MSADEGSVTVVTSDNEHIQVPQTVIKESQLLQDLFNILPDESGTVPLQNIHSKTLQLVVTCCSENDKLGSLSDTELADVTTAAYFLIIDRLREDCIKVLRERIIDYYQKDDTKSLQSLIC